MTPDEVNLYGKICPYPVVQIIQEVYMMRSGETKRFCVDDPLAIKSVPEELEDVKGLTISIENQSKGWNIIISKE